MSCSTKAAKVGQGARAQGISTAGSRSAALAEVNSQVPFFTQTGSASPQISFFERAGGQPPARLPRSTDIRVDGNFTPEALQKITVQLLLGEAAVKRHLAQLRTVSPGIGYGDPRPSDWARSDQQCYAFLIEGVRQARRGSGVVDVSGLKTAERVELWEFATHEADRLLRNIDHLKLPGGPIGGATADYLTGNYTLMSRFYDHLATQLEPILPKAEVAEIKAWREI